ncbi:neutral/alkaline ceramidase [Streptomyces sp. XM4193]|uniref:neutral/alkaline ceramidase n=1 Tax=Streptomyces sp. XM4193 TaxID=2929782 RepID=UPI001FFA6B7F|nr:neutral/alkaline ceramidase [Streptomyces sp. XM4193]MCK1797475.1 neutral/alkaline ceramidase [Streptomyces sp. XM4193]
MTAHGSGSNADAQSRDSDAPYLVGRGIADATGGVAEAGMMGYAKPDQRTSGIHTRQRARSFVIQDRETDDRVLLIVMDSAMIFDSERQAVLKGLKERYGDLYDEENVMITATHSHAGPGGGSHHALYNVTTMGFREETFRATTEGMLKSVAQAHEDLAPSALKLTHGELHNASVNRSKEAFDSNPAEEREFFPEGIDPQTSLLRIEREGRPVGVINWFPTHNTSMTNTNTLISGDNKGYAALHWEREVEKVDYLADGPPKFVAAFAQTNTGDLSPNLDLAPPEELPAKEFENTKKVGERQYQAAAKQLDDPGRALSGGVDSRLTHVDFSDVEVSPEFTGDGQTHRTCGAMYGTAAAAGSTEDGPALPVFQEGENPFFDWISHSILYNASPELKECQSPKGALLPLGEMNKIMPWMQEELPVQLLRIGDLHLIGVANEVSIVSGLRLRQTVAEITGSDVKDVLVAGHSNAYGHYLTTPEEYDKQQYEGGSTMFGRWQLPAIEQTAADLATRMRDGKPSPEGPKPPDHSDKQVIRPPGVVLDSPPIGKEFGDVLTQPEASYGTGQQASAVFAGAHPNNNLQHGGTYLTVERKDGDSWTRVADDGDWSTKFQWKREGVAASHTTLSWDIPADTEAGEYRIRYNGHAKSLTGTITPIEGISNPFTVNGS